MLQRLTGFAAIISLVSVAASLNINTAHGFAKPRARPSQPIPPPEPVLEHGGLTIKVLSYNVQGLPLPWFDTRQLAEIGRQLRFRRSQGTAPHIVAIQEGFHVDIINLINEAGYPYRKDGPGPTFGRAGSGLIILSEFPIVGSNQMIFNYANTAGVDWNSNKGVQHVQIRLPGLAEPLDLLNTHMQADYNDAFTPLRETQAARRRQIIEAGDFMWRSARKDSALMFVGDFNTNTKLGDYFDIVARTFLTDPAETCSFNSICRVNVDPRRDMEESVDHHFYRNGARVSVTPLSYEKVYRDPINGRRLSDHDGLEVDYSIQW